jgi:hypothetical protein
MGYSDALAGLLCPNSNTDHLLLGGMNLPSSNSKFKHHCYT